MNTCSEFQRRLQTKSHPQSVFRWSALWLGPCLLLLSAFGCTTARPCDTTRQCDSGDVCAASLCQALSCGQALLLKDPATGRCMPLSGCFLTDEQRDWTSCTAADPCTELGETACLSDKRCQPVYVLDIGGTVEAARESCQAKMPGLPDGASLANANRALHPPLTCTLSTPRSYTGCHLVPELPEPCSALEESLCTTRPDCQWGQVVDAFTGASTGACVDRRPMRTPDCNAVSAVFGGSSNDVAAQEVACLLNPRCQATGTACYCPAGASCPCTGGEFVACEHNDRQVRCSSDSECATGETCRPSSECPVARNGIITNATQSAPCLGICAAGSCGGLDEGTCSSRADCFAVYATECSSSVSRYYQACPLNPAGSAVVGCLCDNVYQHCADVVPIIEEGVTVRSERSLLVRDPAIVENSLFRLDNVLKKFARPGEEDALISRWFQRFQNDQTLPNGLKAQARDQFDDVLRTVSATPETFKKWLTEQWHTTALINRLDLIAPGTCGEARIAFAYNGGYTGSSTRMTIIVELKVPDDGQGCKQVAAQWLELSAIDDAAVRLSRLQTLYTALLRPEHLGQVRTNEFINPSRRGPWELREWHLINGDLQLAGAKQAVDMNMSGSQALLGWVMNNLDAVKAGTAEVPNAMLSAAVVADGRLLRLPGSRQSAALRDAEAAVNKLSCAGCHVGSTGTPFVHIGERLSETGARQPIGRAVISEFLMTELPKRATTLRAVWQGKASLQAMRSTSSLRVH